MDPSEPNLLANPAENQENWIPSTSVERGTPNMSGDRPLLLGVGAPNTGWQNLAGTAIAGGSSPITQSAVFSGCSTSMLNAIPESCTLRAASMSRSSEQHAGLSIGPSCNLPAGCTQVPISIVVFHRRLTGRDSRLQLPLSQTFVPAPALPGVPEVSEIGASTQLAQSYFLSLGRESFVVASDTAMNPSALATPDEYNSEHSPIHLQANGVATGGSKTGIQGEDSQQSSSSVVICDSHSKLESVIPSNTGETQGEHPEESTGLLAEGLTDDNMHKYQRAQKRHKTQINQRDHTDLSTPCVFKERRLTQIEMQISGAGEIETFDNEKDAPGQKAKPRRKKHRPKVIREDKPAKKQKPAVTTPEVKPPSQKAKRSYVRKKRKLSSPEKCTGPVSDQSIFGGTGNAARSRSASVRRKLQFELEEQVVQGDQSSMGNTWLHNEEKPVHAKSSLCSVAKSAVQIGHELQIDMENSPGVLAFGMSRKLNKLLDEYIHLPEVAPKPTQEVSPATSGSFSRELGKIQDNVGSTHDPDCTRMSVFGVEEGRGMTVMEGNNNYKDLEMNCSNIDGFDMYCSEIEHTKSQMSKESNAEKKNHVQHNDSESSLTGTQDSIILRTAAEMLAFCQAGGIKKKRSVRVRRNSFVPVMDIENNTSQASTRLSQPCMEALYESSCIKFMTKKRSQKARLHSPSSIQPSTDQKNRFPSGHIFCGGSNGSKVSEGTFQQTLTQALDNKRINLDIYCEVPERSSANTSTVPYIDYLQGVESKLKYLDLNTEHGHRTDMHSSLTTSGVVSFGGTGGLPNALVPYVGSMLFPYERPLHLVKKQRPRAKVNLDFETTRVWNLLMGKAADPVDGTDVEKERWWQQEREVFQGRANSFIARMRLVQGDRHFSPWKGSVVDSVVGVFLTQNVSDHLSSSAYMALAANFPPGPVNSSCKDDITTQDNEDIVSMSAVRDKSMFDFFGNGARPDLGVNFEELSIMCEKIHVEKRDNTSAYELTKGENYSLCSKASNGNFSNHQGTEIDHKAQQFPDFSSVELTESTKSPQEIQFQKEMSSSQSVITSEGILQSRLSLSSGMDCAPRNFVGGTGVVASKQLGSSFDDGNSLAGNDATTNEIECQRIKTAVINDGVGEHEMHSSFMMYPFISTIDCRQLDVRNEPYVASTSPNSSSGSASPHLKNGTIEKKLSIFMPFGTYAVQRNGNENVDTALSTPKTSTELPVKLPNNRSTSFEASDLQEHELLSATGGMLAERASKASKADEPAFKSSINSNNGVPDTAAQTSRPKKTRTPSKKNAENFDWDKLRRQACNNSHMKEIIVERRDSVDWEAVRCADVQRISNAIRERGMNNVLAERIQNFLNRLVRDHGSIDLEWLRDIPPDSAKDYLLSIRGLGLKSVECVRLLTLHHLAFPVDTNVGRICVRLGWVPIQPLPESLQLHLLELYPVLETIQKYLWPRLCKLDQQTLYELHYQMITFGKVFCTKSKPNCNACPMRSECKHFASAFASARLALPSPEEKSLVKSSNQFGFQNGSMPTPNSTPLPRLEGGVHTRDLLANNSEPIIEEPASPREEECPDTSENDIEDFDEDTGEIPTIKLNMEAFAQNLENCIKESNTDLQSDDIAKALVTISTEAASIPVPKLKNVHRLRTEHYVYELPDSHPLVQQLGLDQREPDDPSPYLLTIWMPDEMKEMSKPPKSCCDSQMEGGLCNNEMCHYCMPERENQSRYVRGTILVPCRTAMRGSFPLNGTYFQVNEVFADHKSSHNPIHVARAQLWNLHRRMVYFGTTVPTIFKGLTTEEIQHCFWRGFVCVRGFDMETRAPRPLCPHLHLAASKLPRPRKTAVTDQRL